MLDRLTKRIMDSFHQNAKTTLLPIKEAMKKNVDAQISIGSGVLKFGTMILLFLGILKMGSKENQISNSNPNLPSTIVINNYIRDKEVESQE